MQSISVGDGRANDDTLIKANRTNMEIIAVFIWWKTEIIYDYILKFFLKRHALKLHFGGEDEVFMVL